MNVKLLRKVKKHILEEPRRYDQDATVCTSQPGSPYEGKHVYPACGTIACIGGWALVLSGKKNSSDLGIARQLLDLDYEQADRLFGGIGGGNWPELFDNAYLKAKTLRGRVRVAARRIEHFIKTEGRE